MRGRRRASRLAAARPQNLLGVHDQRGLDSTFPAVLVVVDVQNLDGTAARRVHRLAHLDVRHRVGDDGDLEPAVSINRKRKPLTVSGRAASASPPSSGSASRTSEAVGPLTRAVGSRPGHIGLLHAHSVSKRLSGL